MYTFFAFSFSVGDVLSWTVLSLYNSLNGELIDGRIFIYKFCCFFIYVTFLYCCYACELLLIDMRMVHVQVLQFFFCAADLLVKFHV